jgi:hypothetical protein
MTKRERRYHFSRGIYHQLRRNKAQYSELTLESIEKAIGDIFFPPDWDKKQVWAHDDGPDHYRITGPGIIFMRVPKKDWDEALKKAMGL